MSFGAGEAVAVPEDERALLPSFHRTLVVTVHQAQSLPAMDSDGSSDPYCTIRYGSSAAVETSCIRNSLDPVWNESFEFNMHPDKVEEVVVDVFDRDWVLGIPLKPDYIGQVTFSVDALSESRYTAWFPLRNLADGSHYKEAQIQLSFEVRQVAELENQASFWGLLRPDVNDGDSSDAARQAASAANQEVELLRRLFPHIRPIINHSLRFMFVGVRPFMLLLLWHRRMILDWEKPGSAILFYIVAIWSWWKECILGVFLLYCALLVAYIIYSRDVTPEQQAAGPPRPSPAQMVEAYKETKAQLMYRDDWGRDPLLKDIDVLEVGLRKATDLVQLYMDNMFFYGDRHVAGITFGGFLSMACLLFIFPNTVDDFSYYIIRYSLFYIFVRYMIIHQISHFFPWLFPKVFSGVLNRIRVPLRHVLQWWRKTTQLRQLTKAEEHDQLAKSLAGKVHMSTQEWDKVCSAIGHKIHLRKGQVLEEPGTARDVIYRLRKGKLQMRPADLLNAHAPITMVHAPASLLAANMLYGSGIVLNSIFAFTHSVVMSINVVQMRYFFSNEPVIAEHFFLDLLVQISLELDLMEEKLIQQKRSKRIREIQAEKKGGEGGEKGKQDASELDHDNVVGNDNDDGMEMSTSAEAGLLAPVPVTPLSPSQAKSRETLVSSSPSTPKSRNLIPPSKLQATQAMFSMSTQQLNNSAAVLNGGGTSKMAVFFSETFGEPVQADSLKVFEDGLVAKRGWTRYPGRLFVTPTHLAFWSQVGHKGIRGAAAKGATVESWILPLKALESVSLHERDSHVAFVFETEAALKQKERQGNAMSVFLASANRAKRNKHLTIRVYSENIAQLGSILRTVEELSSRGNREFSKPNLSVSQKLNEEAEDAKSRLVPSIGGVELTAGSVDSDLATALLSRHDPSLNLMTKKVAHEVGRVGKEVKKAFEVAFGAALPGKDHVPTAPEGLDAIMTARSQVLSESDKEHLLGTTEEERDRSLLFFTAGDSIVQADQQYERALFQLNKGNCTVYSADGLRLGILGPGQLFGVMGFILHEKSRFTVKCNTDVELRHYTAKHLTSVFEKHQGLAGRFYEFLCYHTIHNMNLMLSGDILAEDEVGLEKMQQASEARRKVARSRTLRLL